MKFFPTVPPMAEMSPTCSIIVANAIGTMVIIEERRNVQFTFPLKRSPNTVSCILNGRPNHAALDTELTTAALDAGSMIRATT